MDAVKFIKERSRMCKSFDNCSYGCPAWGGSCKLQTGTYLECEATKQVEIVEKWSAAHPQKTRQSVFLEQWPEAELDTNGAVAICPTILSRDYRSANKRCKHPDTACYDCRRDFWMQEVE